MGLKITFPKLTSYQQATYDWLADPFQTGKICVVKSPRQRGKTAFCGVELISMALKHAGTTSYVFEPTLSLARKVFKSIEKSLLPTGMLVIDNSQLLELGLSNGSTISFRSTEQTTSRGLTVTGLLVLDECAYLDDETIFELLPLVNANKAPILICSTPFIKDGYYFNMWELGLTDKNKSVKSFDWNGYPDSERFITAEQKALYKQTMSPQKYRTEIEGEFLEDGGLLFVFDKCIMESPAEVDDIYIGIDFASGKGGDYTVLSALNKSGKQIALERVNNLQPMEQVDWLAGIINNLSRNGNIRSIKAESNSLGVVYIDALRKACPFYINEFTTSNESKRRIITQLQLAFEQNKIGIMGDYVQINELRKYEMQVNPKTKTVTYNGAAGSHDDTVIALSLAYDAYIENGGGVTNGPYIVFV